MWNYKAILSFSLQAPLAAGSVEGLSHRGLHWKGEGQDYKRWRSPALILPLATTPHGNGRLNSKVINTAWNEVCRLAGVKGHTPHDARHAMGKLLIEKAGNLAAMQRQLGHTNPAYSMQYTSPPYRPKQYEINCIEAVSQS
jgi:integrase